MDPASTVRYRLDIEYDGAPFVGWQRQDNGPSVQAAIETAVARFCGEQVTVIAAGRTDAGVHALGQVAHLDLVKPTTADTVRDALNHHLSPQPIAILVAAEVPSAFHARFSAIERRYIYRILDRRAPPTVDRGRVWHVRTRLDEQAMHGAAQVLVGKHDFTSFRATLCQARSPEKTLDDLTVERRDDAVIVAARARSFLHHQVRNMVGTLVQVGLGRWSADDVRRALLARDRSAAGPTAPADGLYLVGVSYPEDPIARSAVRIDDAV